MTTVTPKPTLGRIVHFLESSPKADGELVERAAIIVAMPPGVDHPTLKVLMPTGSDYVCGAVPCAAPSENRANTWHWPERV